MDIADFDARLRAITQSAPGARPFICGGSPLDCDVVIVGFNPASDVPFWPYWQPPHGFHKREWEEEYLGKKRRYSPTRLRINRLVKALGPNVHCLETNLHAYASRDAASLPAALHTPAVLQFLLDAVRPTVAFFHGKEASDFAAKSALPPGCRCVTGKHLRLWSYEAVDELAESLHSLVRGVAQTTGASDLVWRDATATSQQIATPCECGCGEQAKSGAFLPGHDQRLRASLERRVGGLLALRGLVEAAEQSAGGRTTPDEFARKVKAIVKTVRE